MKRSLLFGCLAVLALFAPISSAHASASWDLTGNWVLGAVWDANEYFLPMDITSMNLNTGLFSGTDPWGTVNGTVTGSSVYFVNGWGQVLNGTIASDGTMSGGIQAGYWGGWFWTVSGAATPAPTPIPAGILLLAPGLAGLAALKLKYMG
jgi:hypothetical protein